MNHYVHRSFYKNEQCYEEHMKTSSKITYQKAVCGLFFYMDKNGGQEK